MYEGLEIHREDDGDIERILAPDVGLQIERASSREITVSLMLPSGEQVEVVLESRSTIVVYLDS